MASKWVEFRDNVEKSLDFKTIDEKAKQELSKWLLETGMPLAEKAAENFLTQVKQQAANETGWSKIRDTVAYPLLINGAIWIVETILTKSTAQVDAPAA